MLSSAVVLALGGIAVWVLTLPLTTRQGVNYRQTTRSIPAYVKSIDFMQRHFQYRLLASNICAGLNASQDCMLAILRWTGANIRPTPDGWPVIDDHVLHIIIRGHGKDDQIADVFTTLSTYAGIPAFWMFLKDPNDGTYFVLSFARLQDGWIPLDVERQRVFRANDGRLATVGDLLGDPRLIQAGTNGGPEAHRYLRFISKDFLDPFVVPEPLRAELHQPWQRWKYELELATGLRSAR